MTPPSDRGSAARIGSARAGLLREARLSRAAIDSNLSALLSTRSAADAVVDVRADAYGHGLSALVGAAAEHGIRRFRVSAGDTLTAGLIVETGRLDAEAELAVYGFVPQLADGALRPALTLVGEVVAVKQVPAGSAVSYGYTYRTDRDATIVLVGLGYADGVPRLGSSRAKALVAGNEAIVAGRIAMDQFVLDLGEQSAAVGDEVTVWGSSPTLLDWSAVARRLPQHLTAGIGRRVVRTWADGAES